VKLGHRPGVFEIGVMRKISGTKRDRIKAGWIKQHNEKLHDLYYRVIKWRIRSAG